MKMIRKEINLGTERKEDCRGRSRRKQEKKKNSEGRRRGTRSSGLWTEKALRRKADEEGD